MHFFSSITKIAFLIAILILSSVLVYAATSISNPLCSLQQVSNYPITGFYMTAISGNGNRAAVSTSPQGDYTEIRNLTTNSLIASLDNAAYPVLDYDGSRIAFYSYGDLTGQNADYSYELFLWDNGTVTQLTSLTGESTVISPPDISADGTKIVFAIDPDGIPLDYDNEIKFYIWREGIGVESLFDSDSQPTTSSWAYTPIRISADGQQAVFLHDSQLTVGAPVEGGIYSIDLDTETISFLFSRENDSPFGFMLINDDASRVAFDSPQNYPGFFNGSGLWIWDAEDGFRSIDQGIGAPLFPLAFPMGFSADGSRLLFTSGFDHTGENPDGTFEYFIYEYVDNSIRQMSSRTGAPIPFPANDALSANGAGAAIILPTGSDYAANDINYTWDMELYKANCTRAYPSPTNLRTTNVSQGSINLAWNDNASDENGYRLERSINGTSNWTEIASLSSDTSSYTEAALSCSTTYHYRLRASWGSSYSMYSNILGVTTSACASSPNAPDNLHATTISDTSIGLAWNDNASDETAYYVERSNASGTNWTQIANLSANANSYTDTVSCNTGYQYRVRVYRSGVTGYTAYSGAITVTSALCPTAIPPTPPLAPSDLLVTSVSRFTVILSWVDNASDESNYYVERSSDNGASWTQIDILSPNVSSYTDQWASCDSSYQYRVRAYIQNLSLGSDYSNVVSATTHVCLPAPSELRTTSVTRNSISLAWNDNAEDENQYRIERSTDAGASWTQIATAGASANTYYNNLLTCGTNYQYRVRAWRSNGSYFSAYSNVLPVNTVDCLPPLTTPANLQLTDVAETSISLSWDDSPDETIYYIERSFNGGNWVVDGSVEANTTSYTLVGLECNSNYQIRIRSRRSDDGWYSEYSEIVSTTSLACTELLPPSNLHATSITASVAILEWDDNTNETRYYLERSDDGGASWVQLNFMAVNTVSYTNSALTCETSYQYRIRAWRSDFAYSDYSDILSITTGACPLAPSNLRTTGNSSNSISIAWDNIASDATRHLIYVSSNAGESWVQLTGVNMPANSYTNNNRICETNYWYRVRAYRSSDNSYSAYSNTLMAVSGSCPNAPANLRVTDSTRTSITIAWDDTNTDETRYMIEFSSDGVSYWGVYSSFANITTHLRADLSCGRDYYIRMRTLRGTADYSPYTDAIVASTLPCPSAPSDLVATAVNAKSISFSWVDNTTDESGFILERSDDGGLTWDDYSIYNSSSYTVTSLYCGSSYQFRIRVYIYLNNYGLIYSDYSNLVSVTTSPCPVAPTNLLVTAVTENSVSLVWEDNSDSETRYLVERGNNSAGFGTGFVLPINTTSYTNVDLDCNRTYYYRAVADQAGVGNAPSNIAQVTTLPCLPLIAPSNVRATYLSASSINLEWDENNADEDFVAIERSLDDGQTWKYYSSVSSGTSHPVYQNCYTTEIFRFRAYRASDMSYSPYSEVLHVTRDACAPLTSPTNLNHNGRTATSITLTWTDSNTNESSFQLEYSANGTSWSLLASPSSNSYNQTGLNCGQSFYYRVRAYRDEDNSYSPYSANFYNGTSDCPNAPSNLRINGINSHSVGLAWYDNATDESSYRIERSTNGGLNWSHLGSVSANTTTYNDTSVTCGNSYKYRIRAYRSSANVYSAYSNILTAIPPCPLPPPVAPSNLIVIGQGITNINLAWTDNASDESNYRIERSKNGGSFSLVVSLGSNVTAYNDTGLSCGTRYSYRVQAYRSSDARYSEVSLSNIYTAPCSIAPGNLRVTANNPANVVLGWDDNGEDESGFRLERSTNAGLSWTLIASPGANSIDYNDTGVICGQAVQYRIGSYRSADNSYSGYSNVLSLTVSACPAVNAPTNLIQASTSESSINLSWTDNASDESNYRIERSNDNGTSWTEIAQVTTNVYSNTGLNCETSYQYRVRAYRNLGNSFSAYSNTLTASTNACPVNAPTDPVISVNQFALLLAWTDNASNESDFELQQNNAGVWQTIANLPANTSSINITGLLCQTSYQYRIRAYRLSTGVYSSWLSLNGSTSTCPTLVVANLSGTASENTVSLSWTADGTAQQHTLSYSNGVRWFALGTFSSINSSFNHTGLACGQSYQYRVSSYRTQDNATVFSNPVVFSTASCSALAAPSAPIILNTQASLISLQIPAMPAGATSMTLERSLDGVNWLGLGYASSSFLDVNVICATSYHYRLIAFRASDGQFSPVSATASTTTPACPVAVSMIIGTYNGGTWSFVDSNTTANPANTFSFGDASWQAIVGDWDGDGVDGIGLYRNGEFILRTVVGGVLHENRFSFGDGSGWQAIAGDWNGDGIDSIGIFGNGQFILSDDNLNPHYRFNLGDNSGWQAIAGDWDGNGADGIALYKEGRWLLVDSALNPVPQTVAYGPTQAGWLPIAGDWNGDGTDTIGLYNNGVWRIRLVSNTGGAEGSFVFGTAGAKPLSTFVGGIPNGSYAQDPFLLPSPEPELTPEITPES